MSSKHRICPSCDSHGPFHSDYERGDIICSSCGCVVAPIMVVTHSYNSVFDRDGCIKTGAPLGEAFVRGECGEEVPLAPTHSRSGYKRSTYFAERISQWRQREPAIEQYDFEEIWRQHDRSGHPETYCLTKEDIRQYLRNIDRRNGGKTFVTKYLEKWLTIRFRLCGVASFGVSARDTLDFDLKSKFEQVHRTALQLGRHDRRISLISYNFIFRRIFDLLGVSDYGLDFPPLKNHNKRVELVGHWLAYIKFLNWPYLNSDGSNFGPEFEVDTHVAASRFQARFAHIHERLSPPRQRQQSPERVPASHGDDWTGELFAFVDRLIEEW